MLLAEPTWKTNDAYDEVDFEIENILRDSAAALRAQFAIRSYHRVLTVFLHTHTTLGRITSLSARFARFQESSLVN